LEAKGKRGSCYEYIKQTVQFLRAEKIDDENLESLYQEVRKIRLVKAGFTTTRSHKFPVG
jgi:cation transport regulator ChaC